MRELCGGMVGEPVRLKVGVGGKRRIWSLPSIDDRDANDDEFSGDYLRKTRRETEQK